MEKIKLVIWDLDDTFWEGTISEGDVKINKKNIEIVKKLTNRGIINSIVSKNNYDVAKEKLIECGIWDYFVFPKIDWIPKGELIKNTIKEIQLRDVNVLFIDDNHLNLEEAKFYSKNLNAVGPDFIKELLEHPSLQGKNDVNQTRLKHYKILEKKQDESKKYSDNTEFLKQSNIIVTYVDNIIDYTDRIYELINRTNQLNYTKKRISLEELESLLINQDRYESKAISVSDKYGDYGVVGFVCIDKIEDVVEHFLFSCRTINLGVEQFVYAELDYPQIKQVGEVITKLDNSSKPDWIKIGNKQQNANNIGNNENKENKVRILLKGGCDLSQMVNYLTYKNLDIISEMNYVLPNNNTVHREHTVMLRNCVETDNENKNIIISEIPFLDEEAFSTRVFEEEYDILVYSLLMDYTQELYLNINSNVEIPYGGYNNILEEDNDEFELRYKNRNIKDMDKLFLKEFKKNHKYIGQISKKKFLENLNFLRTNIKKPIIFINGTEIGREAISEKGSLRRHREMNLCLDEFIKNSRETYLVDLREIITSTDDVTDNIRHYKKNIYIKIAEELVEIVQKINASKLVKDNRYYTVNMIKHYLKVFINKIRKAIRN